MSTINFANNDQKTLWEYELLGQISDGMWENSNPFNHHIFWCKSKSICDSTKKVGVYASYLPIPSKFKNNYRFNSTELIECVGDRMIAYVKMSRLTTDSKLIDLADDIESYHITKLSDFKTHSIDISSTHIKHTLLTQNILDEYWNIVYSLSDLRKDLKDISTTIKTIYFDINE